jgi:hypothetical protein
MKVAFLREKNDFRAFNENYFHTNLKELGNNVYDICEEVPFLGYILASKSDYFLFNNYDNFNFLEKYDVIITIGPFLKQKYKKNQLLMYFEKEPDDLSHRAENRIYSSSSLNIKQPYDVFLNNYDHHINQNNICCPYLYDVEYFKQFHKVKTKNKLFVQRRTKLSNNVLNYFPEKAYDHSTSDAKSKNYNKYYEYKSDCEYAVTLCQNKAAGQVIAESSLLNIICFAKPHKLFSKILLPDFCYINNENDFITKVNYLNTNEDFKNTILKQIEMNVQKINNKHFNNLIENCYEKFINRKDIELSPEWMSV